ncbi:MAG TPA: DNA-processing protein DprA [Beutenbergiaceae bacterium]|nr:DNA-processing protein DprA [Beutenbergiaceae bacterium]
MTKPAFDITDERLAAAAWSRIAESDDVAARPLLSTAGAVAALDWLYRGAPGTPPGAQPAPQWSTAAARWLPRLHNLDPRRELEVIDRRGGRLLLPGDDDWPAAVDDLPDPPWCLWKVGQGSVGGLSASAVSIVGARACTDYGHRATQDLAYEVGGEGITIVSGGAFGIDAAAHHAALAADAPVLAVMAGGLDRFYPSANSSLLQQVAEHGAVVAEVPPGTAPMRSRFLRRNRLIAALGRATVVVEAGWRSGALNTARTAGQLLRPVGAFPGPVTSAASAGCHRLIRDGEAVLVTSAHDVLELVSPLGSVQGTEPAVQPGLLDELGPDQARVLDALPARAAAGFDGLVRASGLTAGQVRSALGLLELGGHVSRDGSGWRRVR